MDSTLSNVAGLDFVCLTVPAALKYVKAQSVLEAEGGSTRDKGLRRPLSFVSFTFLHFYIFVITLRGFMPPASTRCRW